TSGKTAKQVVSVNLAPTDEETIIAVRPKSSKSKFGLIAVVSILMVAAASAGAYFFSDRNSAVEQNLAAQVGALPTPSATPASTATQKTVTKPKTTPTTAATSTPAPTPNPAERASAVLNQAKALEDREQYAEAIAKYQEYQQLNPGSAEAGLVNSKLQQLSIVSRMLSSAKADMEARRYTSALEKYRQALRVKSNSAQAQAGEAEARAKMTTEMPQVRVDRPQVPPAGQNQEPNRRRIPPSLKRMPRPTPQPDSERQP
ncbi:MAG: hypothetical protein AAB401_10360, partial [Acidobacteriota bacterium]